MCEFHIPSLFPHHLLIIQAHLKRLDVGQRSGKIFPINNPNSLWKDSQAKQARKTNRQPLNPKLRAIIHISLIQSFQCQSCANTSPSTISYPCQCDLIFYFLATFACSARYSSSEASRISYSSSVMKPSSVSSSARSWSAKSSKSSSASSCTDAVAGTSW